MGSKIATYDSVALRFAKQVLSSTTSNKKASLLQAKALEGICIIEGNDTNDVYVNRIRPLLFLRPQK